MAQATVTPKYVNPVQAGKKNGTIKLEDGTIYGVPPALLGMFTAGQTYTIQYESNDFKGKTYHTVKSVSAVPGAAPAATGGGSKYGQTDDVTAERIFVCGGLNAFITAGKVTGEDDIVKAVMALRGAWSRTFGGKTKAKDDMDDEIPF